MVGETAGEEMTADYIFRLKDQQDDTYVLSIEKKDPRGQGSLVNEGIYVVLDARHTKGIAGMVCLLMNGAFSLSDMRHKSLQPQAPTRESDV